ncbi:hypothetical protein C8J55DRAFT_560996 [Lentinula edodes]|uniref:Uncharacterized protein n=1 Tax=Lentinula lateritia TaxID=40482 RepID=A0A9W9AB01_9AGAR|nr:hypothetical protein C8J55DRAFT_560996 [Lentinula edodes]
MASREERNYRNTEAVLASLPNIETARLGLRLGLCYPNAPWAVDPDKGGLYYLNVATLPLDAAVKVQFFLRAISSPTRCLRSNQMEILVRCDERELNKILRSIVTFLERIGTRNLNAKIESQAKELCNQLAQLFKVELKSFSINENALEMFR